MCTEALPAPEQAVLGSLFVTVVFSCEACLLLCRVQFRSLFRMERWNWVCSESLLSTLLLFWIAQSRYPSCREPKLILTVVDLQDC